MRPYDDEIKRYRVDVVRGDMIRHFEIDGIGWSDHWSFWQEGYQGVMITDTAPFRYPYYHHPEDLPDKLDFNRMTRVVDGLVPVVEELAGSTEKPQHANR